MFIDVLEMIVRQFDLHFPVASVIELYWVRDYVYSLFIDAVITKLCDTLTTEVNHKTIKQINNI